MPLVSVILAVYNGEKYICDAIESILNQTFQDFELIILNDGSTDQTKELIKPFLKDKSIRYYEQPNKGISRSLNRLIELAQGKYLAVHDHDDISLPTRLEEEVQILESHPECELVYSPTLFINVKGEIFAQWGGKGRQLSKEEAFYELYVNGDLIPIPVVMMRKRHILTSTPFNPQLPICQDFQHLLELTHDFQIYEIPHPLIKMRRGEGHKHMSAQEELLLQKEIEVVKNIYQKFKESPPKVTFIHYAKAMSNLLFRFTLYYLGQRTTKKATQSFIKTLLYNPFNRKAWRFILRKVLPYPVIAILRRLKKAKIFL